MTLSLAKPNQVAPAMSLLSGTIQNGCHSTMYNLSDKLKNVSAARSRIKDTDFATETATLARYQIIQRQA